MVSRYKNAYRINEGLNTPVYLHERGQKLTFAQRQSNKKNDGKVQSE